MVDQENGNLNCLSAPMIPISMFFADIWPSKLFIVYKTIVDQKSNVILIREIMKRP